MKYLWKPSFSTHRIPLIACAVIAVFLCACGKNKSDHAEIGPVLKWQYKAGGAGVSHPAIGNDGTIYFGANDGLYALSPDGKLKWRSTLASAGTPVIAPDGSLDVAIFQGLLFGYGSDGTMNWRPQTGMIGFAAPPAVSTDNAVYVVNSVSDIFAFRPPRADRFDWSRSTFREGLLSDVPPLPGEARASGSSRKNGPLLTRSQSLIVPRQNWLQCLSPSGDDEWITELTSGSLGAAAIADDGTVYVGDDESVLYAVDASGTKKWTFDAESSVVGSPVLDTQELIYFAAGKSVYALTPDGNIKWKTAGLNALFTGPVLAVDGTIYVGGDFALYAIKPDGTLKWNLRVMSPTSAPSIGTDGTIYFACGYSWMCAASDSGSPLMKSSWPKQFHDLANTSNALTGEN